MPASPPTPEQLLLLQLAAALSNARDQLLELALTLREHQFETDTAARAQAQAAADAALARVRAGIDAADPRRP